MITFREAGLLLSTGLLVFVVSLPFAMAGNVVHLHSAAVAVLLCVPTTLGTFCLARWMNARHPLGGVLGMLVGTMIRLVIAFGLGTAVFVLTDEFRSSKLGFWIWLLFAYLSTLLVETILLVRSNQSPVGGTRVGKG